MFDHVTREADTAQLHLLSPCILLILVATSWVCALKKRCLCRIFTCQGTSYTGPAIPKEHRHSGSEHPSGLHKSSLPRFASARRICILAGAGAQPSIPDFDLCFVLVPATQTPNRQKGTPWECPHLTDCQVINVFQGAVSCFQRWFSRTEKVSVHSAKTLFHTYILLFRRQ